MRRAVLATMLCAAPLLCATAHASGGIRELQALREVMRSQPGVAAPGAVLPLPLPEPRRSGAAASSGSHELVQIARTSVAQRVLVGASRHRDLAWVARVLRRLGAEPEAFHTIGVVAATVPSGPALARALGGDPRVAYVERDRSLRIAQDPFDAPDPQHGNLKFTWFFDDVRAAEAIAAAGGGSRRTIAVLDTGLDTAHPEFAGRVARRFDTRVGGTDVTDTVGHGTFVSGLIAAVDGNGIGGKGVAGNTKILAIRASRGGLFTGRDLLRGIDFAVRRGADVLNMSVAGGSLGESVARALGTAFLNDVLPVAASGNLGNATDENGVFNPIQYPAALLGGRRGARGIGLSVAGTRPNGTPAPGSTHNEFVSLAGPGWGSGDCRFGVFSTLPFSPNTDWDAPESCSDVHTQGSVRFAYGEGTSFAAPIVSGIAALTWQVERRLASEQVAEVLTRSARQTQGSGWNEFTGAGIVDGAAATALARVYDVSPPRARGSARRHGGRVRVHLRAVRDRTEPGRELAGHVTYGLLVSRDGGRSYSVVRSGPTRPFSRSVTLRGRRVNVLVATACDGNGNCGVLRLGRFRP